MIKEFDKNSQQRSLNAFVVSNMLIENRFAKTFLIVNFLTYIAAWNEIV